MRYCLFFLLTSIYFISACQHIAPEQVREPLSNHKLPVSKTVTIIEPTTIIEPATISKTPTVIEPATISKTPTVIEPATISEIPVIPKTSKTYLTNNSKQTKIDNTYNETATTNDTQANETNAATNNETQKPNPLKSFEPKKIIGLPRSKLKEDLGPAHFTRLEGLIEIWQYHFTNCIVDFFFFPKSDKTSQLILKTWDMRGILVNGSFNYSLCQSEINIYHRQFLSKP